MLHVQMCNIFCTYSTFDNIVVLDFVFSLYRDFNVYKYFVLAINCIAFPVTN